MARKAGAGKSLEKSEKHGVEAASKVTKRRAIPSRNHLGCRDLQAAIPGLRDALPTKVPPATGRVADARFRAIQRRLTHGRARYKIVPVNGSGLFWIWII